MFFKRPVLLLIHGEEERNPLSLSGQAVHSIFMPPAPLHSLRLKPATRTSSTCARLHDGYVTSAGARSCCGHRCYQKRHRTSWASSIHIQFYQASSISVLIFQVWTFPEFPRRILPYFLPDPSQLHVQANLSIFISLDYLYTSQSSPLRNVVHCPRTTTIINWNIFDSTVWVSMHLH
jgi:hypothetical protein